MRWSYKTVHFGLKKDGLLGSAFVDDTEIEETLNEYGQGGWELVSMFETRDGVLAVFKQGLEYSASRQRAASDLHRERQSKSASIGLAAMRDSVPEQVRDYGYEPEPGPKSDAVDDPEDDDTEFPIIGDDDVEPEVIVEEEDDAEDDDSDTGIGSIRIE